MFKHSKNKYITFILKNKIDKLIVMASKYKSLTYLRSLKCENNSNLNYVEEQAISSKNEGVRFSRVPCSQPDGKSRNPKSSKQ